LARQPGEKSARRHFKRPEKRGWRQRHAPARVKRVKRVRRVRRLQRVLFRFGHRHPTGEQNLDASHNFGPVFGGRAVIR
jgi:hypothetical protein